MTLYKNKYRVESIRLRDRNYAANGWYFVTICTHNRIWYFGNVENNEMQLSPIGKIAQQFWSEIPQHSKHTKIDAYVIMPNHVHGIVIIDQPNSEPKNRDRQLNASTSKISPKSNSLSVIIRSYKSSVTRWCWQNGYETFKWQTRFYENIIRQDDSLETIQNYIFNNPKKWHWDQNNLPNLLM
jgi:REP element-mobilizing transposase RayT